VALLGEPTRVIEAAGFGNDQPSDNTRFRDEHGYGGQVLSIAILNRGQTCSLGIFARTYARPDLEWVLSSDSACRVADSPTGDRTKFLCRWRGADLVNVDLCGHEVFLYAGETFGGAACADRYCRQALEWKPLSH
jgi:hypothetical protein